ncbi:calcineurin [Colletotrichum higginsianum]|nr:calcineurin [Colletotrichum higginsianum]
MPPKKRTTVAAAVPLGEADANPRQEAGPKSRKRKSDAVDGAAYPSGSTHKIAYNSLSDFLKKKGPTSGNTSSVFYAAYVFFEKLCIVTKKHKGKTRLEMEILWPDGFDTHAQMASYILPTYATLTMDQYDKVRCY